MEDRLHPGQNLVTGETTAPQLFVHIGMPKTGTSLIQAVLARMRAQLAEQEVWLPERPMAAHRIAVEAAGPDSPVQGRADVEHIRSSLTFEQAVRELSQGASARAVIASSEYFSECRPDRLADLLAKAGFATERTGIVAALRRQDRILVSGFNQDVKALQRTLPLRWDARSGERLDWFARLQPWREAFGRAAIRVQVFDRDTSTQQSLTGLFLETCGLSYDVDAVIALEEELRRAENASLPADLLAFKFNANRVTRPRDIDWLIDEALARGIGDGVFGLDDETVRSILDHYRESNRRVAAEYLGEDGELFDDVIVSPTHTSLDVPSHTLAALVALSAARPRAR